MPKLYGDKCEVRIATTEAGLADAPVISQLQSIEWDVEQNVSAQPKGEGYGRAKEVTPGLIDLTGSMTRWYNKDSVVPSPGTTTFADMVQAYQTGDMTALYIQAHDIAAGETHTLKKAYGKYHVTKPIDGYSEESYDFSFEELTVA